MTSRDADPRRHMLHTFSIQDSTLEAVANARVEPLPNHYSSRPYFGIITDSRDSLGLVNMTGGDIDLAQTLMGPICDALNAQDIALYRTMQDDITSGIYEARFANGEYKVTDTALITFGH